MLKRDMMGLLNICCIAGCFLTFCVLGFVETIRSIRKFWAQDGLAYHLFDGLVLLFLLLASALIFFLFARSYRKWLHLEHARNAPDSYPLYDLYSIGVPLLQINSLQQYNPDASPSYDLQRFYMLAFVYNEQPSALKKMMARRDILQIIQALSFILGAFWLFWEVFAFVMIINSSHKEATLPLLLFTLLVCIILAILLAPIVAFIISLEYERIEVNEHGLRRQHGLVRRFIRWDEVRLFAVGGKADNPFEWIELSSARVVVRWPYALKSAGMLGGLGYTYMVKEATGFVYQIATPGEYLDQLQRVYWYVQQRTNQPLRDLRL